MKNSVDLYNKLVTENRNRLFSHAIKISKGNVDEANDLLQDGLVKALVHFDSFDPEKSNFRNWVMRIISNHHIDNIRKHAKSQKFSYDNVDSIEDGLDFIDFTDTRIDILGDLINDENNHVIKSLIDELPEECIEALRLIVEEDYSYKEAAQIMNISVSKFYSRIICARKQLRERIKQVTINV